MNRRLSRSKNNHCQWGLIMFTKLSCDCLASLLLYVFICNDYLQLIVFFLFRLDHGFWSTALFPFCLNWNIKVPTKTLHLTYYLLKVFGILLVSSHSSIILLTTNSIIVFAKCQWLIACVMGKLIFIDWRPWVDFRRSKKEQNVRKRFLPYHR